MSIFPKCSSAKCIISTIAAFPGPAPKRSKTEHMINTCRKGFPGTSIKKKERAHWNKWCWVLGLKRSHKQTLPCILNHHIVNQKQSGALEPSFKNQSMAHILNLDRLLAVISQESSIQKLYSIRGIYSLTRTHGATGPWPLWGHTQYDVTRYFSVSKLRHIQKLPCTSLYHFSKWIAR